MLIEILSSPALPKICIAALALILFALSCSITLVRSKTQTWFGAPPDPTSLLTKLVRAQGNTAEYVGILAVMIFSLSRDQRPLWASAMMALAVSMRLLFAIGMLTKPSLERFSIVHAIGAGGTYVAGIGLALAVLLS